MKSAALMNQAMQLHQQGQLQKARALYERVLKVEPTNVQALHLLGVVAAQTGHHQWAVDLISRAIARHPGDATFHNNRGNSLIELGRIEEALGSFDRAIALNPDYAEAYYNRGDALHRLGRLEEALSSYDATVARAPDFSHAHNNRGNVLRDLGRTEEALVSYDRAIMCDPLDAELHFNRATVLRKLRRLEVAVTSYARAIELNPMLADAHNDLGATLRDLGRPMEALSILDRAISLAPEQANAHVNRGTVLLDLEQAEESILSFDRAIALKPDYSDAYANKGHALLAAGRLREGWPLYERGCDSGIRGEMVRFAPDWDGRTQTSSLLVLPEQGVGDQIFYASMLLDLQAFSDAVTVAVDPRLVTLFERSFSPDGIRVVSSQEAIPDAACQVYMGSLGQHLRNDFEFVARARIPYLESCTARRSELRNGLAGNSRMLCGVSWRSTSPRTGNQKSVSLQTLAPLFSLPDVAFLNLQYGDTQEEQARLREATGLNLINVNSVDNFNDLDGLAALIDACDVVVTVSNTTAHLAGALGKNLMLILSKGQGLLWYWHYHRSDSPWYPTARLFRQNDADCWDDVVESVKQVVIQSQAPRR